MDFLVLLFVSFLATGNIVNGFRNHGQLDSNYFTYSLAIRFGLFFLLHPVVSWFYRRNVVLEMLILGSAIWLVAEVFLVFTPNPDDHLILYSTHAGIGSSLVFFTSLHHTTSVAGFIASGFWGWLAFYYIDSLFLSLVWVFLPFVQQKPISPPKLTIPMDIKKFFALLCFTFLSTSCLLSVCIQVDDPLIAVFAAIGSLFYCLLPMVYFFRLSSSILAILLFLWQIEDVYTRHAFCVMFGSVFGGYATMNIVDAYPRVMSSQPFTSMYVFAIGLGVCVSRFLFPVVANTFGLVFTYNFVAILHLFSLAISFFA